MVIDGKLLLNHLGNNCIQICHLGRYIVGYTVGNFVLRRRVSGRISEDNTSQNDKLEYGYPHSNVLFNIYTHQNQVFTCMSDV